MFLHVRGSFVAMRGPVDFRLCSEVLEYRRIYMWRRKRFTGKLMKISSYRAKRKRRAHGDLRSTNFFAARMTSYVKRRDRSNDRLLSRYALKYEKGHKLAQRLLRMAQMKKEQTTTCRGWQQEEIRTLLERAMNLLFWT